MTGILSATSREVIRRNAAYLPAYSFLLGLLALTGFMALALAVDKLPEFSEQFATYKSNFAVPALILHIFPGWFAGDKKRRMQNSFRSSSNSERSCLSLLSLSNMQFSYNCSVAYGSARQFQQSLSVSILVGLMSGRY